ncbi:MAG: glycosyltransferase family 39 protein [Chitinophagaceae bacterium]|nr:glycosyltransferase family 39 protein [Chitinophagaceae bacterium]
MSKKNQKQKGTVETAELKSDPMPVTNIPPKGILDKLSSGWLPYCFIVLLGILLYANTFNHEFALDDEIIICENPSILKGMDGIGEIFSSDIFDSYNKSQGAEASLTGGRYRPFSLATFAIEQEFIGTLPDGIQDQSWDLNHNGVGDIEEDINKDGLYNMNDVKVKGMSFRHVNNVLLYIFSICVLYMFFVRFFFKDKKWLALLICLLFLTHPIHTEVVANVKSRDEILSLMFMVLTMYCTFNYVERRKRSWMIWSLLCYFFGLLSKEYGVTLLVILPVSLYVYYKQMSWKQIAQTCAGLLLTFIIYFGIRSSMVASMASNAFQETDLLNNPYLYATGGQALATKIFINLKYVLMLIYPTSLSCDYGFNSIPYRSFSDPAVWGSLVLLISLSLCILWAIIRRNSLVIPLLFILTHLVLVNNFLFNIGATMGERLVYHSSLGVCILLIYGVYYLGTQKFKLPDYTVWIIFLPLMVLYSIKTFSRNPAWKNDITLYFTDIKTHPNSTMLNGNLCKHYFDLSLLPANKERKNVLLDSSLFYGRKAMSLYPKYAVTLRNMGVAKVTLGDMDSAAYYWLKAKEITPNDKVLLGYIDNAAGKFYNDGNKSFKENNLPLALVQFQNAHEIKPNDHRPLYFLGMVYLKMNDKVKAKAMWNEGLKYAPNDQVLKNALIGLGN